MDYQELLDFLGLEEAAEFEFFENFADLIEGPNSISLEAVFKLLKEIPEGVITQLIEAYFNEALEACPDTEADIYTLLETIKRVLMGLSLNADDDKQLAFFADELLRFKEWYINDSLVLVRNRETDEEEELTVMEALAVSRLDRLERESRSYDFTGSLGYSLDDNVISYSITDEDEEDYDYVFDEDEDYKEDGEEYQ